MTAYRKKPCVIEAKLLKADNGLMVSAWCRGVWHFIAESAGSTLGDSWLEIFTLEGTMRANVGDYIIRGVQGEFYPCRADIFKATYELVCDDQ